MSKTQKEPSIPSIVISPYEILKVPPKPSAKDIRKAYKDLVRIHTPEHSPERFMEIRQAYDMLLKPENEPTHFPVYKKPIQKILNHAAMPKKTSLSITLLQTVFETPFDTYTELKTMLDNYKSSEKSTK